MTRINVGVEPSELSSKHLLAEHREIKRIPNVLRSGRYSLKGMPQTFTLGKGHVKFFYKRIGFLRDRYARIHQECLNRAFDVTDFSSAFEGLPEWCYGEYTPSAEDRKIILDRIASKRGAG